MAALEPSIVRGRITAFTAVADDVVLSDDNEVLDHATVFGNARQSPSDGMIGATRQRKALRCELCNLSAPLRSENWTQVFGPIYEANVRRVQLAALAAQIRQLYDDSGRKRTR